MSTDERQIAGPYLERLPAQSILTFTNPSKQINDGDDLTFFLSSTAYRDIMTWLLQLNRSLFPSKVESGHARESRLDTPPTFSDAVRNLRSLLSDFETLIREAPPDTGPRRFGNVAFRSWFKLAERDAGTLIDRYVERTMQMWSGGDQKRHEALREELTTYLLGSFGSAQRLDYGTGHELSFLAFLGCLWKLGLFNDGEEKAIVIGVIQPYLDLVRTLVQTYTLEPAGSHGVWGLDDHSFVPYIFGSAQLGPAITRDSPAPVEGSLSEAPPPSAVTDKRRVADFKDSNMYFSAIQFIYDVKRGPFWEHSPVLYDVSGIKDGWGKINKGMLKMYAAEVLGKFPVVQHFPFGTLFKWEIDPQAQARQSSIHAQNQPARSMDVPPAPSTESASAGGAGTKASWASGGSGAALPQMQSATGMPSTRAPWAKSRPHGHPGADVTAYQPQTARSSGATTSAAPRASSQLPSQPPDSGMPATTAPWARQQGGSKR